MSKKIILLFGPTASGKSKLAIDIAKKFNGEILNADSMQVYKEIKILSARPDKSEIKHHFYGFISAKNTFSVGKWCKLVAKKIKEIQKKNKTPIVVGGTGLYFRALIEGLVKIPKVKKLDYSHLNPIGRWMMGNHYHKKNPTIFEGINRKIILLFGPTASGKSKIAEDIAKTYNAEIINADSMQIYKQIKILSARPEKKNIKHHLYGFVSITKTFSTGAWYKLATKKIKQINK